jgi:hypothetical protein
MVVKLQDARKLRATTLERRCPGATTVLDLRFNAVTTLYGNTTTVYVPKTTVDPVIELGAEDLIPDTDPILDLMTPCCAPDAPPLRSVQAEVGPPCSVDVANALFDIGAMLRARSIRAEFKGYSTPELVALNNVGERMCDRSMMVRLAARQEATLDDVPG